ncbi:MAG: lipoyl(octanoyl) transferase LipB [Dehalococcoidia bacterium]|nr:lipoyl(octanoyl) transferase LipB [Dehalococcoidia bacterium]
MASTSVVLPWSTWAMIATLRRSLRVRVTRASCHGRGRVCAGSRYQPLPDAGAAPVSHDLHRVASPNRIRPREAGVHRARYPMGSLGAAAQPELVSSEGMEARLTDRVELHHLGCVGYEPALAWQRATAAAVRDRAASEALALLEHPPVYTVGAGGGREHLRTSAERLERLGARVIDVDRGGDITFHGPGQLVAYPILQLRRRELRPTEYVRGLESTILETLRVCGVEGELVRGRPGVWVDGAKVAAIGVRVRGGVTTHGLALNVTTGLEWFDAIVPCGIAGAAVTSLERLLGRAPAMTAVEAALARAFERAFGVELVDADGACAAPVLLREAVAGGR